MSPADSTARFSEYQIAVRGIMTAQCRESLLKLPAAGDEAFRSTVDALYARSQERNEGRFLARMVFTLSKVFPNVYVFSSFEGQPGDDRDTFVIACAMRKLNLDDFGPDNEHWNEKPFAWIETDPQTGGATAYGQMSAVVGLSEGHILTDNYAPVDNLLAPVVVRQDN
jgi:hypothetical protein